MSISCFHCSEDCENLAIKSGGKNFCCEGCQLVYEILNESGLEGYYDNLERSKSKVKKISSHRFDAFDNEKVKEDFLTFNENNIGRVTFFLPAIHCSSCIWLLENLDKLKSGFINSRVDFSAKRCTITFDQQKISLKEVAITLAKIGYTPEITRIDKKKGAKSDKSLLYKIAISGFCFGNIMLISLPEYFDTLGNIDLSFSRFFVLFKVLLSLPVLVYCSIDYFTSAWKALSIKSINIDVPIAIGIVVLFIRSVYEISFLSEDGYFDSLTGLVFFLLIGKWYQSKIYGNLSFDRDYKSYFPLTITRVEREVESNTLVKDLTKGDTLRVRNQELIPVDSVLKSGSANIDYSFVTGESMPVLKKKGDIIYAGGRQVGDSILLEVTNEVENSDLVSLWEQEAFQSKGDFFLKNIADRISKYFSIIIVLIALFTGFYWAFFDKNLVFYTVTSVLIIACPCALALSVPFTFGNSMRCLGRKGFFLKKADLMERLSTIDTIVFDKTGTITDLNENHISYIGDDLTIGEKEALVSLTKSSTHPLSKSIYKFLRKEIKISNEEKKVNSFKEEVGKGLSGSVEGYAIKLGSLQLIGEVAVERSIRSVAYLKIDEYYKGRFEFEFALRKGLKSTINSLISQDHELHVLSGDNDAEKERLQEAFSDKAALNFYQKPIDKLNYIKTLQKQGKKVMMFGDGLNDAGGLKQSDLGVSIVNDEYGYFPACSGALRDSSFSLIPSFISYAKKSVGVVKVSFAISFLYNLIGLFFAVQGLLTPVFCAILMPISSVTVVVFTVGATNLFSRRAFNKINYGG